MGLCPPPDERRCTGIATGGATRPERKGERCLNWAIAGGFVCEAHGGSAQQVRAAANRRLADEALTRKAAGLIGEPVDNPLAELANLAGRARAFMELMEARVQTLMDGGETGDGHGGIRYKGGAGEQLRAEVALYERAMDRLGKFLADFGRLNIDERLAKLTERQVDAIVGAIDVALNAVGVRDPAQRNLAKQAAGRHLQKVA